MSLIVYTEYIGVGWARGVAETISNEYPTQGLSEKVALPVIVSLSNWPALNVRMPEMLSQLQTLTKRVEVIEGIATARTTVAALRRTRIPVRYLTEPALSSYEIARVESQGPAGFWAEATSTTLLLLRGLLAGGVLPFALRQERSRVQYGLDPRREPRTRLVVPYQAKDSPTLRSEFSYPDIVIVLT
ncbi:hypothetical protein LTR98_011433 [Exophiala xenobiotica]|nr:hypothetical protein LTR14_011844 [Exophiala xenobiotica]KAK5332440.1 hypothetical protein LTR98_011433 [Exophiala xenobiotica]KAK5466283.1 hypothetical protein LTR55_011600 [Exophiala xenobiotica]